MVGHRRVRIAAVIAAVALALSIIVVFSAWAFTTSRLALASSEGVYPSAEVGMRTRMERAYDGISQVKIVYAGPNSFEGSQPHIWYVIAEVRAASRAGGSEMGTNGCDAPGSFFLQTRDGWVHVPEGAFPELVGFWMKVFGLAGPGEATPTTEWALPHPGRFCQSGMSPATDGSDEFF
jgi:hypothetical protein